MKFSEGDGRLAAFPVSWGEYEGKMQEMYGKYAA